MVRMRPRQVWHLRRGQKLYGRISDPELRLLAELGHLKSGDLLWRPGLGGWKSPESIPDLLAPSLQRVQTRTAQSETAKISALFFAAWREVIRSQDKLTLFARNCIRSVKTGGFLRPMQWRGVFVGLLIAAAFVGSIDVAIRAFAIGAENTEKAQLLQKRRTFKLRRLRPTRQRQFKFPPLQMRRRQFKASRSQSLRSISLRGRP
jgi:hypothetical protein